MDGMGTFGKHVSMLVVLLTMVMMSVKTLGSGQVVVGGYYYDSFSLLSNVELFPRPPSDTCFIPELPQPRRRHSLSLLSGGRLVVCGGGDGSYNYYDSCISWVAGNTSWTPLYTTRCLPRAVAPNQSYL